MNGQNLTKFCIHIFIDKIYVGIVKHHILANLQQSYDPWLTSEFGPAIDCGVSCPWPIEKKSFTYLRTIYTPGIYADGYIVFVFPFVRLFVRNSVTRQSFASKFLKWCISQQLLIRKHSYLDHSYPGGLALTPWPWTPGSMPWGGARGQNLGHLKKRFF